MQWSYILSSRKGDKQIKGLVTSGQDPIQLNFLFVCFQLNIDSYIIVTLVFAFIWACGYKHFVSNIYETTQAFNLEAYAP